MPAVSAKTVEGDHGARGGLEMPNMRYLHIVPHDDAWAIRREGAERVSSIHSTQGQAVMTAKGTAIREHGDVFIHRPNGKIRDRDSW